MPKQKNNDQPVSEKQSPKKTKFQLTLLADEQQRFETVLERAQMRVKDEYQISSSYVIRRLVGLEPPSNLVTAEDIDFFLHSAEQQTQVISELPPAKTNVKESDINPNKRVKTIKKAVNGD